MKNQLVRLVLCLALCSLRTALYSEEPLKIERKFDLTVCAVFQNEAFYLKEWLEFHKLVGVQHFYLYNNLSSDNYLDILKPYIESGVVDLTDWPVQTYSEKDYLDNLQLPVYNHALNIAKETSEWIAFIDLDEFLFPVIHSNLIEMLKNYEDYAALSVNWQIYGTSQLDTLPEHCLIIESLIYKAETTYFRNMFIKMIVQPQFVKKINHPHYFEYLEGYYAIDSSRKPLPFKTCLQPVIIDIVRINHYWSGPLDLFLHQKLPRRKLWGINFSEEMLAILMKTLNQTKDDTILRFLPQLKEIFFNLHK